MKKVSIALLYIFICYLTGVFISNEFSPLNWWTIGKIAFIIALISITSALDEL